MAEGGGSLLARWAAVASAGRARMEGRRGQRVRAAAGPGRRRRDPLTLRVAETKRGRGHAARRPEQVVGSGGSQPVKGRCEPTGRRGQKNVGRTAQTPRRDFRRKGGPFFP